MDAPTTTTDVAVDWPIELVVSRLEGVLLLLAEVVDVDKLLVPLVVTIVLGMV